MRKQTGFKFKIEMRCTITDPVERRHRLAQVYAFFERGMILKQRDASLEDSGNSNVEGTEVKLNDFNQRVNSY